MRIGFLRGLLLLAVGSLALLWLLGRGTFGTSVDAGSVQAPRVASADLEDRADRQQDAAETLAVVSPKQILFGDLHVHSTYSLDAFAVSLPILGGEGAHPVADACDFARYCSGLDFWSINDHAVSLTAERWNETLGALRECQAVAGDQAPDLVTFAGWEWTQMGSNPQNHYGHKNVIFRDLEEPSLPTRPIFAIPPAEASDRNFANLPGPLVLGLVALTQGSTGSDVALFMRELGEEAPCAPGVPVRELPPDCREGAATPAELFAKLDDWDLPALVIPHGTSWGMYTPQGSSWQKQATTAQHDPRWQKLIEIYSGHGNSEEFRAWTSVDIDGAGGRTCPAPGADYVPSCWQAGEIIRDRCRKVGEGAEECEARAVTTRQRYVDADISGFLTVPGARMEDWLDSGQCRDCFQPAFNFRPRSSVQYITALGGFEDPSDPVRLRFGFLASSDVHSARPGTGYKEVDRAEMTDARLAGTVDSLMGGRDERAPAPRSEPFDPITSDIPFFARNEVERAASFFTTGGLVAVHAAGRDRAAIWDALDRREVYGTSGPHILLWFDLLNAPGGKRLPMGAEVELSEPPAFEVRAMGSFGQEPGCADASLDALGPDRVARLCRGECRNPGDRRRRLSRIEVVRIRPQRTPDEPVAELIEDPWRVFPCRTGDEGCRAVFTDPEFVPGGRETVYYVRAIEEPSEAINAGNLRCRRDETGACLEIDPCPPKPFDADCLATTEHRAWSSPIFIDHTSQM